jgi:hypothetical protein
MTTAFQSFLRSSLSSSGRSDSTSSGSMCNRKSKASEMIVLDKKFEECRAEKVVQSTKPLSIKILTWNHRLGVLQYCSRINALMQSTVGTLRNSPITRAFHPASAHFSASALLSTNQGQEPDYIKPSVSSNDSPSG